MAIEEVPWLKRARDLVGLKEISGPQHEPRILSLAKSAGLSWVHDDETPWCAIFVGGVLAEAGFKPSGSAAARSYQTWGMDVTESGPLHVPLGSIIVFNRPPNPEQGHVAFAVGYTRDMRIVCLGGNQKNSVSIEPFPTGRIVAARWPEEDRADLRLLRRIPMLDIDGASSAGEA